MKTQHQTSSTPLREALASASNRLAQNPDLHETAARDAELLLLHTLQIPRTHLFSHPETTLTTPQLQAYEAAITRRLALEPIQYITGIQEFYGLTLQVTPAVLIPRPETELLVEAVLQQLSAPSSDPNKPLRIADIGTGSGAIAIAIAHHLPQARVTALDISPEALAIARQNAGRLHLSDRICFLQSDLLAAVAGQTFDAILSNPPYVPTVDHPTLHPQVRDHEPHTALFSGLDGLEIYARLIPQAQAALVPNGLLALEFGHGQQKAIRQLLTGWRDITFLNDLQQIPRTVLARKALQPVPRALIPDVPISPLPEHNSSMKAAKLQTDLYALEERLLHPDREPDRAVLVPLLAADFKEFCSSGRIFNRAQTIEALLTSSPRSAAISHFQVTQLADGVVLATYNATTLTSISHRSSLWVQRDNRWQLLFHQGTVAI